MSEPRHSVDPFTSVTYRSLSRDDVVAATVSNARGERVALVLGLRGDGRGAEALANARLFAAAPDLLGACLDLLDFWDNGTAVHPGSDVAEAVRIAVARTEGEPR